MRGIRGRMESEGKLGEMREGKGKLIIREWK